MRRHTQLAMWMACAAGCMPAEVDLSDAKASSHPAPTVAVSSLPAVDQNQIIREINRHRGDVGDCYRQHKVGEGLDRAVGTVELLIAPDGSVKDAKVVGATARHEAAEKCIVDKVKRWSFPSAANPRRYPYSFELSKGPAADKSCAALEAKVCADLGNACAKWKEKGKAGVAGKNPFQCKMFLETAPFYESVLKKAKAGSR
jgi:hypothetical protein